MKDHVKTHTKNRKCKCEACKTSFSRKKNFGNHLKVFHTSDPSQRPEKLLRKDSQICIKNFWSENTGTILKNQSDFMRGKPKICQDTSNYSTNSGEYVKSNIAYDEGNTKVGFKYSFSESSKICSETMSKPSSCVILSEPSADSDCNAEEDVKPHIKDLLIENAQICPEVTSRETSRIWQQTISNSRPSTSVTLSESSTDGDCNAEDIKPCLEVLLTESPQIGLENIPMETSIICPEITSRKTSRKWQQTTLRPNISVTLSEYSTDGDCYAEDVKPFLEVLLTESTQICPEGTSRKTSQTCLENISEPSTSVVNTAEHASFTNGTNIIPCYHCEKKFTQECHLEDHYGFAHPRVRPRRCPLCEKSFLFLHHFKEHLLSHASDRPLSCPKCPRKFANQAEFNFHLKIMHNGEVPCPSCGKRYSKTHNFIRHMQLHKNECFSRPESI